MQAQGVLYKCLHYLYKVLLMLHLDLRKKQSYILPCTEMCGKITITLTMSGICFFILPYLTDISPGYMENEMK